MGILGPSSRCPDAHQSLDPPSPAGMLLALLLLPWAWGALAASPPLPPVSVTLRMLQIDVFHNASSTDADMRALLGDLETHSLNCSTCEFRFLQPWAQQGLTPKQWQDLELLIHYYLFDFNRTVNRLAQQQRKGCPFVTLGCKLHPNGTSRGFYDVGVNREDFISFDVLAGKWVARQGDKLALYVRQRLNWNKGAAITLQFLLRTTCVNEIKSFVQHGKESLERQGHSRPWGPGLAVGITLGALAVAAVAVVLWWRVRRGHQDVPP